MKYNGIKILRWVLIGLLIALAIWLVNKIDIEQVREQVDRFGIWAPAIVFGLRFTSIIIPVLPGTAYAILAGGLFGFVQGLLIVVLADLASCTFNFYIARRYGRGLVERFVGQQFMEKVDHLAQRHLERNFFLMTGIFDFAAYAVGLTKTRWQSYLLALVVSILIAKPLWVATGAGIFEGSQLLLGFALLGAFGIGIVTAVVQRQSNQ
ncbi:MULTISPECIES: TVP38/TMEM64 family protein [unclassified Coleofasciculus]|uniref:TVP38/TMEM64 family protein n=1 Tax=unclassified Coleofasciculus TaxID=2692782 RepID=UPI0018807FEC|nr:MULTISPECIES: VTT domain-containing protein [unclassified Coleofasciculus]MBE9129541.1 TVP38/TMEM64 family protein [Coleofasciculus sp. LEGE 07081]MBE9150052.1 TVP38/TMEM64 family protein [Coleofasciculus sp. LEGE 07092]